MPFGVMSTDTVTGATEITAVDPVTELTLSLLQSMSSLF
jgi:hypothetical protein